jgi:phosphonate transport system permease protein
MVKSRLLALRSLSARSSIWCSPSARSRSTGQRVAEGWSAACASSQGFLQPDFTTRWRDISQGLIESLTMTLTSTVVGVLISIPIGIGAARNIAPRWIYADLPRHHRRQPRASRRSSSRSSSSRCSASALRRLPDADLRHHRLHRQAAGRGYRGYRRGQAEAIRATGAWWQLINYASSRRSCRA